MTHTLPNITTNNTTTTEATSSPTYNTYLTEQAQQLSPTTSASSNSNEDSTSPGFFSNISQAIKSRSRSSSPNPQATSPASESNNRHSSTLPIMSSRKQDMPSARRSFSSDTTLTSGSNSYPTVHENKRQSTDRSDFQSMTYGRHSKDWLFNGFSVKNTIKGLGKRRSDSPS